MRAYFLKTQRIGFSRWNEGDRELSRLLWGDGRVTKFLCASGKFTQDDVDRRLQMEIENGRIYGVQYWPVFDLSSEELVGCCGLRPYRLEEGIYEIGFHLRPEYWGRGLAAEAARAVIRYAFDEMKAGNLFAGHNPNNTNSKKLLGRLGFHYTGDEYYAPTGLYHPSYLYRV